METKCKILLADETEVFAARSEAAKVMDAAMQELGVPAFLSGTSYLREAVLLALYEPELDEEAIYARIAEKYRVVPPRVCRAITHAFTIAWGKSDLDALQKYFGSAVFHIERIPSNAECIARLKKYLQSRLPSRRPAACAAR